MKTLFTLALLAFLMVSTAPLEAESDVVSTERKYTSYYDTTIDVTIYHDGADMDAVFSEFEDALQEIHQLADQYEAYEGITNLKTINDNPGEAHEVDPHLFEMISTGKDYYDKTDGYFNIALGPVINIWQDLLDQCVGIECTFERDALPESETLEAADAYTDVEDISLNADDLTVQIEEGMHLDLGGIAKGYGAEVAAEVLKDREGIEAFILNAGTSNIEVYGENPERESGLWRIDIVDPAFEPDFIGSLFRQREHFATVYLEDGQHIVGSGNYERFFTVDGVRYHHLIDPYTLYPTGALEEDISFLENAQQQLLCQTERDYFLGTWLITDDGYKGDIHVTAAYLMDVERSIDYVERLEETEGVFFGADERIFRTENFDAELHDGYEYSDLGDRAPCILPVVAIGGGFIVIAGGGVAFTTIKNKRKQIETA